MKRALGFVVFFGGVLVAIFYTLHTSDATLNVQDYVDYLKSWLRKVGVKLSAAENKIESVAGGDVDPYKQALDMISDFEGFSAKAYPDANGFSIGYGHFIRPGDPYGSGSVITEEEAYALLEQDARTAQACVAQNVSVPLNGNQTAALISLAYNIGCGNFKSSTLLKRVNAGDFAGAQAEFSKWIYSQGVVVQALVSRRSEEAGVFAS